MTDKIEQWTSSKMQQAREIAGCASYHFIWIGFRQCDNFRRQNGLNIIEFPKMVRENENAEMPCLTCRAFIGSTE